MPHGTAQGRACVSLGESILAGVEYGDTYLLNSILWTGRAMRSAASRSIATDFVATSSPAADATGIRPLLRMSSATREDA